MTKSIQDQVWEYTSGIPERIRSRREELGFSMREVAEYAQITAATLSNIENGKTTNPGIDTLVRIAWAIGATPEWVIFGNDK